jgi:hypothetical protein
MAGWLDQGSAITLDGQLRMSLEPFVSKFLYSEWLFILREPLGPAHEASSSYRAQL